MGQDVAIKQWDRVTTKNNPGALPGTAIKVIPTIGGDNTVIVEFKVGKGKVKIPLKASQLTKITNS